jgi:hypothetical protein
LAKYSLLGDEWREAMDLLREIDDPNDQRQALEAIYRISQGKEK